MPEVVIKGYPELQKFLKNYEPELRKELNKELKVVANRVAADAKAKASWSSRIPRSIGVSATMKAVSVKARRARAPHASLYELGSGRNSGAIRHPLFGNRDHWYSTPTRPFLAPAAKANAAFMVSEVEKILVKTAQKVGFKNG